MSRKKTSRIWNIPKEELQYILDTSTTIVNVLEKLGYNGYNGNYKTLLHRIYSDNLDMTIFNENRKQYKVEHLQHIRKYKKIKLGDILKENCNYSRITLKRRLIQEKILKYKCSICGLTEWNNKPISLQLDHINGVSNDNRIENLRFLCPNCHSQTETFSGKHNKINNVCECCNVLISNNAKVCNSCASKIKNKKYKKFDVSVEELVDLLKQMPITKIGKKFGVSDTCIRKRCNILGITIPKYPTGYWLRKNK